MYGVRGTVGVIVVRMNVYAHKTGSHTYADDNHTGTSKSSSQLLLLPFRMQYMVCLRHLVPVEGRSIASSSTRTNNKKARERPRVSLFSRSSRNPHSPRLFHICRLMQGLIERREDCSSDARGLASNFVLLPHFSGKRAFHLSTCVDTSILNNALKRDLHSISRVRMSAL